MSSYNTDRNHRPKFLKNITADNLKVPLEEALNIDLKEVVIPGVYPDKLNGDFSKTYIVQIKKIVEIGPNKVLNSGGGHHRSLLLHLSDGHVTHKALEIGEIPGLSLNTRPGTKVIIFGPKLRIVGNSFIYLDANMAQVLGGGISELNAKWEMSKSLENRRRDNTSREGGAPAWAPFGKKINKDSLKVTRNTAPPKEEKKNPAFESQRKDAILTAARAPQPKRSSVEENSNRSEKNGKDNRNQYQRQSFKTESYNKSETKSGKPETKSVYNKPETKSVYNKSETKSVYNKSETRSADPPQKFVPSSSKGASVKSPDKDFKESTSHHYNNQFTNNAPKSHVSKEPLKIAQKEPPVQVQKEPPVQVKKEPPTHSKIEPVDDSSKKPIAVAQLSFPEQFQKPPPNFNNYSSENPQWKSKTYSNGNYQRNQPDIIASHNTGTDFGSFPIPSQAYTASSYSGNLPNQSFAQSEFYISNTIPAAVPPTTRSNYEYKTISLPTQSHVSFPTNAFTPAVNPIQNYSNTNYFDASLQPPLPAFNKNDYGDNCVPPQTLVFTSSAFSDAQAQNPIPGFVANTFDASKLPYSRTQFSEPPPSTYDSQSYTRSNYIDNSSQNWIQPAEPDKAQPYQYLKTNYNAIPSQSPPVQVDYDNQSQLYSGSSFSNGNNVPQKLQNEYVGPYQINAASNYNDHSQKPVQSFDQSNYGSQTYVYNSRGNFSGGSFPRKKTEEFFGPRGFQRQNARPPFKPNMRGTRGRGFAPPNQPRYSGPPTQPGVLYEYLDNKLHINTG